jgi:hypothetical protein
MLWEGATASTRQAWTSGNKAQAAGRALWIGLSTITAAKGLSAARRAGAEGEAAAAPAARIRPGPGTPHTGDFDLPPLKLLHPETSLRASSLKYWGEQTTEGIVSSLRPGAQEPLLVKADGTIMQGNTRIYVLQQRGYDVNSLPRTLYRSDPLPGDPYP